MRLMMWTDYCSSYGLNIFVLFYAYLFKSEAFVWQIATEIGTLS